MRHFIIIVVFLSVCNFYAQSFDVKFFDLKNHAVLSSAGSSHQNEQVTISWTLGNTLLKVSENTKHNSNYILENTGAINVYPNPTSGKLMISQKLNKEQKEWSFKIDVYDINSKLLNTHHTSKNLFELDLTPYPSAMYIIMVKTMENIVIKSFKIIKE